MGINKLGDNFEQKPKIKKSDIFKEIKDSIDIEMIISLEKIFEDKQNKINTFLKLKFLRKQKFSEKDFEYLIKIIYYDNNAIKNIQNSKKYENSKFEYILKQNIRKIEQNFDLIFQKMINDGDIINVFLVIDYLEKGYGYDKNNFVKNFFSLENIYNSQLTVNTKIIEKKLNNLKTNTLKEKYLKNLKQIDFYGEDYKKLNKIEKKLITILINLIKTKLKQLYIK